jgi:hypothetical protein
MDDAEWISLLEPYGKYFDELPDGTIVNAGAIAIRDMVTDAEGDGDYAGGFHEVRFAEADAGRWDGINWDWDSNVRIREEGFGYEIFDGGDNRIASGADVTGITFVDPDADVLAKFNATVADTSVMVDFMTQHSLKAASDDSSAMVIQSNTGSEIMATVTDFGDYYGIRDIETNDWLGWISSYDGDDGNTHIGFGFDLFDLAGDMPDAQKTLITDFLEGTLGPSSEDYSIAEIDDYRLVVKKVKDGDTVTETYAYAQHLNANGGTLGSTGVDVTNSKFIQMYNRLDTETDQVPDKETPITAEETANIYSSINAILDVIMNQGTVGTLAGLDASTVITPLEPENSGADDDYDVEIFVNADNLLYVDDYTGVVTIEKSTSDEVVLATSAEYDPTFSIYHDDFMGSIDLTSVFKDGLAANVTLADVITNWPSLIDDLTAANSNNSDFALELMSMSDISISLHDSSGTDTTNTSGTTDGSYDHFDPTSFVVEWMIDSMDTFTSFDASTLAVVSEPTIPFEDDHSGGSISASDDTSGGDTSGSPSMYPTFTTYLEDPSATVLIEIHSMSELSDTDLAEVLDLVLFDPSANAYTDII